jgi:hypothetical protein
MLEGVKINGRRAEPVSEYSHYYCRREYTNLHQGSRNVRVLDLLCRVPTP